MFINEINSRLLHKSEEYDLAAARLPPKVRISVFAWEHGSCKIQIDQRPPGLAVEMAAWIRIDRLEKNDTLEGSVAKILFVGGSLNQTTMMHKIAQELDDQDCYFTPFYAHGFIGWLTSLGLLNFTILGGRHRKETIRYIRENKLKHDFKGKNNQYDLVVIGTDTLVPANLPKYRLVMVQEGIILPENWVFSIVRALKLPRYLADTAMTGLSDAYDIFCVASPGYRDLFIKKGVKKDKIVVTGIPNFDNVEIFNCNEFPHHNYVLAATSPVRETFRLDNRSAFIHWVKEIAGDRKIIFKLHPNENFRRAAREIRAYAPGAVVYQSGDVREMIANCAVLVTQYSSVTYIGLAMGKEVHSYLDLDELRELVPIQNGGQSAASIAQICRDLINISVKDLKENGVGARYRTNWGYNRSV